MNTTHERAPLAKTCKECNSSYLLEHCDIAATIADHDHGMGVFDFRDKHGSWAKEIEYSWPCPVCGRLEQHYEWEQDAPREWIDAAIAKAGPLRAQRDEMNKTLMAVTLEGTHWSRQQAQQGTPQKAESTETPNGLIDRLYRAYRRGQ